MKTRIAIALPDHLFAAIVRTAAEQRMTISEYLENAVVEHFERTGVVKSPAWRSEDEPKSYPPPLAKP
jgi:hypothetical protein